MHTNDFYRWKYKVGNCTHEHSYVLNFSAKWNLVPKRLWKLRLFRDFITQLFRRASNTNEFVFDALALIISYTWKTDFGFADRNEIRPIVIMKKIGRKFYIYVLDFIIIQISNRKIIEEVQGDLWSRISLQIVEMLCIRFYFMEFISIIYFYTSYFFFFSEKKQQDLFNR